MNEQTNERIKVRTYEWMVVVFLSKYNHYTLVGVESACHVFAGTHAIKDSKERGPKVYRGKSEQVLFVTRACKYRVREKS